MSKMYTTKFVPSPFREGWSVFKRHIISNIGLVSLALILILTLLGPWIAPYDYSTQHSDAFLQPPSWYAQGSHRFIVGTDDLGRDLLSRILFGAQLTIGSALVAIIFSILLGVTVGCITAFLPRSIKLVFLRILDVFLALPSLLLAILLIAAFGSGLAQATLAVTIALTVYFMRFSHDLVVAEMKKDYVKAATLDGASSYFLVGRIIMPNVIERLAIQTTLSFSSAILDIAALGFLGLGAAPSSPEWGTLLSESLDYFQIAPWTITLPGFAIFITVLTINLVGEGLRSALDPTKY